MAKTPPARAVAAGPDCKLEHKENKFFPGEA